MASSDVAVAMGVQEAVAVCDCAPPISACLASPSDLPVGIPTARAARTVSPDTKYVSTVSADQHHRAPGRRGAKSGCSFGRDAFVPVRTHNGGRCHGESRERAEAERVGGAVG